MEGTIISWRVRRRGKTKDEKREHGREQPQLLHTRLKLGASPSVSASLPFISIYFFLFNITYPASASKPVDKRIMLGSSGIGGTGPTGS